MVISINPADDFAFWTFTQDAGYDLFEILSFQKIKRNLLDLFDLKVQCFLINLNDDLL